MDNKLWSKGVEPNMLIEQYTVGDDQILDLQLAKFDVIGSKAHIKMLEKVGLITKEELDVLTKGLDEILEVINRGEFVIEPDVEDVHSQVEFMLTRKYGDIGKKIHSGRSRNDQVLLDLKLFIKEQIIQLAKKVETTCKHFLALSDKWKDVIMPGYTHLQVAMPSSFGLWFGAYGETLIDDLELLGASFKIANQNPLGSAAGYGSSFPLDREMTTKDLDFATMHYNVVAAQMSRGKTERAVAVAIAAIAATIGKFAGDVCLYMCQNFGFVSFPDTLTTGSSIMPHKKNPDVFEIMRGKCNMLQALPNELALLNTNLPLGYNRDLQLMKEILFPAFTNISQSLDMLNFMLDNIIINEKCADDERYRYMYTVEEVNRLVLSGIPFRDAYRKVGEEVNRGEFKANVELNHTHAGSIGNLCNDRIEQKLEKCMDVFK